MLDNVMIWWNGLQPGVQAALVSACATITAATIGALVVARQIRKQAANAIRQNKHNEALKLKMKVYEEIIRVCTECQNAEVSLSSFVRGFSSTVDACRKQQLMGHRYSLPQERFPKYMELQSALDKSSVEMVLLTERWQIIDPRIEVFRTAFNVAMHEIREAYWKYIRIVIPLLPIERLDAQGQLFPWSPPNDQQFQLLAQSSTSLIEAVDLLGSFTHDFQVEMQNLLVGELFGNSVPARVPIDPKYAVVRLDNHAMLEAHFARDTAWGQNRSKVEADVRTTLATQRLNATESAGSEN